MDQLKLIYGFSWLQFCCDAKWKIDKGCQKNFSSACSQIACPCLVSITPFLLDFLWTTYHLVHVASASSVVCFLSILQCYVTLGMDRTTVWSARDNQLINLTHSWCAGREHEGVPWKARFTSVVVIAVSSLVAWDSVCGRNSLVICQFHCFQT